jgi:hypothetical protein
VAPIGSFDRKSIFLVALLVIPIAAGVSAGGLGTLPLIAATLGAPLGLVFIFLRRWEISVGAALLVIVAGSAGVLLVHLENSLRAPLLDVWFASTCGAIAIQGLGQRAFGHDRSTQLRPVVVALLLACAITVQSVIAITEAPDADPGMTIVAILIVGLPFILASIFLGRRASLESRILYIGITSILSLLYFAMMMASLNPPHALLSKLHVSAYRLELVFDSAQQAFVGQEWIYANLKWRDDSDVARKKDGSFQPWSNQTAMQESVARELVGLTVLSSVIENDNTKSEPSEIKVNLVMRRTRMQVKTFKTGLLFHTCEVRIPLIVGLTPAVIAPGGKPDVEIHVFVPEDFGLRHNLDAEFRQVVLPNGEDGLSLRANSVNDLWGVVRLKYPIAVLRNPVLAAVAGFSGWTMVLAIPTLSGCVFGFWVATAAGIIGEKRLKPATERILARIGIIPSEPESRD